MLGEKMLLPKYKCMADGQQQIRWYDSGDHASFDNKRYLEPKNGFSLRDKLLGLKLISAAGVNQK